MLAASTVVTLGGLVFVSRVALAKQLNAWQVIPQPERLTELYFTDYHTLPTTLKVGVEQKLNFTVHNLEHQTTTYLYQINAVAANNGTIDSLGKGSFTLLSNQTQTINQVITPLSSSNRAAVRVNLDYTSIAFGDNDPSHQTQSIHYWVTVLDQPHPSKVKQVKHATK